MPDVEKINVGMMFAGVSPLQTIAIFCLDIELSFQTQVFLRHSFRFDRADDTFCFSRSMGTHGTQYKSAR
jgi:hypothetical protein